MWLYKTEFILCDCLTEKTVAVCLFIYVRLWGQRICVSEAMRCFQENILFPFWAHRRTIPPDYNMPRCGLKQPTVKAMGTKVMRTTSHWPLTLNSWFAFFFFSCQLLSYKLKIPRSCWVGEFWVWVATWRKSMALNIGTRFLLRK